MMPEKKIARPRIAHLTSVHPRYDARIFWKQCKSLVEIGYDVTLIVADGLASERRHGVEIEGVEKSSGRFGRMWHSTRSVQERALSLDADLYHLHDPELLTIARQLKKAGKKVVFDAHEDLAKQILLKKYLPLPLRRLVSAAYHFYEQRTVRVIDGVVTATEGQVAGFKKAARNIGVVENFSICSIFPERNLDFSTVRILHAGALTTTRGLQNMTRLAHELRKGDQLVLAGPLEAGTDPALLSPATYLGVVPHEELAHEYAKANLGLILYNPVGQYGMATAVKLYEYMAAGLPVIVPDHGEWPLLIRRLKCGLAVDVSDTSAQVQAIDWVRSNPEEAMQMGRNGRQFALQNASWECAFKKLQLFYADMLNG